MSIYLAVVEKGLRNNEYWFPSFFLSSYDTRITSRPYQLSINGHDYKLIILKLATNVTQEIKKSQIMHERMYERTVYKLMYSTRMIVLSEKILYISFLAGFSHK